MVIGHSALNFETQITLITQIVVVKISVICEICVYINLAFDHTFEVDAENHPFNWISLQGPWRRKVKTYYVLFGDCNEIV